MCKLDHQELLTKSLALHQRLKYHIDNDDDGDSEGGDDDQGCISCGMCSYPELTKDHVLTSAYVNIFRTVTRNAVNKSV